MYKGSQDDTLPLTITRPAQRSVGHRLGLVLFPCLPNLGSSPEN